MYIDSGTFIIEIAKNNDYLWQYILRGTEFSSKINGPVFELDGNILAPVFTNITEIGRSVLSNGVTEYKYNLRYAEYTDLFLELYFRVSPDSPVVRFRYSLVCRAERHMTKHNGVDKIEYLKITGDKNSGYTEIRLSEFNEMTHTFRLIEQSVEQKHFDNCGELIGQIIVKQNGSNALLVAYEHGAEAPDRFLAYRTNPDRDIILMAVKGNYYNGQPINGNNPYTTVWFQIAAVDGDIDSLASEYRKFQLKYATENLESRKPYIFYNTWAAQERHKFWEYGNYLDNIKLDRMLMEIDTAHRMGVDVFVIDTGWYAKTGDWLVNTERFPDGLQTVREKLDGYGMKLGLWFGPTMAAVTCKAYQNNKNNIVNSIAHKVWETEESYTMCLVSDYWKTFAENLIKAYKTLGVTYFKWDAISQYGCCSPHHHHGNDSNTEQERHDSYAFQIGIYMSKITDMLCAECPDVIVDFDITEGRRYVGLGFLASGKYFLINNGPYYQNYNIPYDPNVTFSNVFVYPGTARPWICRSPLGYDKWIPSVLFLTHYLPDDPEYSQIVNIASLILGQNGIWGDILKVSEQGINLFDMILGKYKKVRNDITESRLIFTGQVGGSPEIYEKINPATGMGAVVIFSNNAFGAEYITTNRSSQKFWATENIKVRFDKNERAIITYANNIPGAGIVLFGCE